VERAWPTLILWKRLPPPSREEAARERRRVNAVLLCALGAAGLWALAAAAPAFTAWRAEPPVVGVVVDDTASAMGAWESIRDDALRFLNSLPADATVRLAVVTGPRAVTTPADAARILRAWTAGALPGNPAAVAAALPPCDRVAVFSDREGPAGPWAWRVHPSPPDRAAVLALWGEEDALVAAVRAYGPTAWSARVDGRDVAGTTDGTALVRVPAARPAAATFRVAADGFPANDARAWTDGGSGEPLAIAGRDLPALRRALEGAGAATLLGGANPRIWIGEVPATSPTGPAILIDPQKSVPALFDLGDPLPEPRATIPDPSDPAVRSAAAADLASLTARTARRLRFTRDAHPLVDPLVFQSGDTLVLAFDPALSNSNFTRLVAWPLFWADAASRLGFAPERSLPTGSTAPRGAAGSTRLPGLLEAPGGVYEVNLDDPDELMPVRAEVAAPSLEIPSKRAIRSRFEPPSAFGAIAGLLLLAGAWLLGGRPK
jgi:hypothetical protein